MANQYVMDMDSSSNIIDKFGQLSLVGDNHELVTTANLDKFPSSGYVVFRASVQNIRKQGSKLVFFILRDGLNSIQAVLSVGNSDDKSFIKWASKIPIASIITISGEIRTPQKPIASTTLQMKEVHIQTIHIVSKAIEKLPIQIEDAERPIPHDDSLTERNDLSDNISSSSNFIPLLTLPIRLNYRSIDLKTRVNTAIFRVKDGVIMIASDFLRGNGFMQINTPKLVSSASEGGCNVFQVKYFEKNAFLAQSPQLYKQMCIVAGYRRVFEVGPVFRAENSNTSRHLTEFTGLDAEMEFEADYHDVLSLLEELIITIFHKLNSLFSAETSIVQSLYNVQPLKLPTKDVTLPRITYIEALKLLREHGEQIEELDDFSPHHEKILGEIILNKWHSDVFTIDKFPCQLRPFYSMPCSEDPKFCNSYDIFVRGQEILSGSQRIHDSNLLKCQMKKFSVSPDGLDSYIQSFSYGCTRHAGGGIGIERLVANWLGLPNVRLASLFPRDPHRLDP